MADPVLATPTMPAGMLPKYLDRCQPHGATFQSSVDTASAAVVWAAPGFPHSNYGAYPADPTLQVSALVPATHRSLLFVGIPPPVASGATFQAAVTTAANAVVWPAPPYVHANTGVYP